MQNTYILIALAIVAGIFIPLQGAVNNRMAAVLSDSPMLASLISFAVGTLSLLAYVLIAGPPISSLAAARNAPWIAWTGGLLGAFFVSMTVMLVPRLGVALTFGVVVAGQMVFSVLMDHFGMLGLEQRPATLPRIIGILLILGGAFLIRKY